MGLVSPGVSGIVLGYPEQALQRVHEALALARQISHPHSFATALRLVAQSISFAKMYGKLARTDGGVIGVYLSARLQVLI